VYSIPAGQPVVTGTTIDAPTFNTLVADLGTEVSDSLSRSGKGAMTAALKEIDGSTATPSYTWSNDPGVGLYRSASGEGALAAGGADAAKWTVAGFFASLIQPLTTVALRLLGRQAASGSAVGVISDTPSGYGAGDKIHSFRMGTAEKANVAYDGQTTAPGFVATGATISGVFTDIVLASNESTSGNAIATIAVTSGQTYEFDLSVIGATSSTGACRVGWSEPGATSWAILATADQGLATVQGSISASGQISFNPAVTAKSLMHLKALLVCNSNGNVVFSLSHAGAGTSTIYAGSVTRWRRIA
jgi:hypothetical protein